MKPDACAVPKGPRISEHLDNGIKGSRRLRRVPVGENVATNDLRHFDAAQVCRDSLRSVNRIN